MRRLTTAGLAGIVFVSSVAPGTIRMARSVRFTGKEPRRNCPHYPIGTSGLPTHVRGYSSSAIPDRDYYVMMLAYGHSRPAPIREVPAENVIVASVANFLNRDGLIDRGSTRGSTHKEQYIAWSKVAKHMMWRPNVGDPAGWPQGQPDVALIQATEDFKLIGEKAMGIFVDMVWEHWATHGHNTISWRISCGIRRRMGRRFYRITINVHSAQQPRNSRPIGI